MKATPEMIEAGFHASRMGSRECVEKVINAALAAMPGEPVAGTDGPHPDDLAVDRFAAAMKAKLAKKRSEGRGGWDKPDECSIAFLSQLLREHVAKGDPVDVGNLAMMVHQRGGIIE